ncbi:MAG: TonB-dependent receptor plug domain-containing protein [Deltaproteobacteria bacterium]|nr:TonB-dependent receptor plug domain-containing protein [Deltaproteobacteria bacterium]
MRCAHLVIAFVLACAGAAQAQLEPQHRVVDEPIPPLPPPRLESPPELASGADPVYPEEARIAGRAGDVVLRIVIDADGRVGRVDITDLPVVALPGVEGATEPDEIARALGWAAMGAATNFEFIAASFCTSAYAEDGRTITETCGQTMPVAIDYKTTFALQEVTEVVPVEDVAVTAKEGGALNFEGIVREAATKDPLGDVEVSVEILRAGATESTPLEERYDTRTAVTDVEGRFSFRGVPDGEHRVSYTLSNYEPAFSDESFNQTDRTQVVIYLVPRETNKFETVVRRRRAQKDVSKIALSRDEVKRVPGTFGDPIRVIENLPGLARAPFIGGALIVRGANPQDSGIYFDGVEIPILYHFGGLVSVVNAEFLEDISFYPGGFGAYYGRATAGIVDVSSRKLKLKGCRGYGEADVMDAGFFFGCPITIGELPTVTFAAAARRSYIDAILPIILDTFLGTQQAIVAAPIYWDYQVKVETVPLPGQTFSLFMFGSDDDLKVLSRNTGGSGFNIGFHQTFHRLVGKWDWKLSPNLRHMLQPFGGLTRIEINGGNDGGDGGPQTGGSIGIYTWNWGIRDELQWTINEAATLRTGVDYLGQTFGTAFDIPLPLEIGSFPRVFPRVEGTEQSFGSSGLNNAVAAYVEAELVPFRGLKVVPGVRIESTIFTFLPSAVPIPGGDTVQSASAESEMFHIDPRLTARWELWPRSTLKGAVGVYRQAAGGQELNPDTGNPDLLEPRAVQLIAGIEQGLTDLINLDVQLYYTNRDLLVQGTSRVRAVADSDQVDPLFVDNGGRGRTIGAEILLRHEISEYLYGWIAYTLSRTDVDLSENNSSFFLTDFDQTHILTVVASTNLPWGFTLGGRFRLVSGNLQAFPLGSVHDVDTTNYLGLGSSERQRLPYFHQLDLRVDRKFVFEQFSATAYLDLLNVYNQANVEGVISDYRSREVQPIPSLPFLPIFGMSAEF